MVTRFILEKLFGYLVVLSLLCLEHGGVLLTVFLILAIAAEAFVFWRRQPAGVLAHYRGWTIPALALVGLLGAIALWWLIVYSLVRPLFGPLLPTIAN